MNTLPTKPYPPEIGMTLSSSKKHVFYEIIEKLSHGGFGITYKVVEHGGESDGAIRVAKLPNLDIKKYSVEDIKDRIRQGNHSIESEMQALSDLSGTEGVASILDLSGEPWTFTKYGSREFIMVFHTIYEFIEGDDIDKWCEKNYGNEEGKFKGIGDSAVWFSLARSLFTILDKVHHRRVVHGDIWPPNIRIDLDESPVIIDFGQAWSLERIFGRDADNHQSHPYLAPERNVAGSYKKRWYATADIYSMGGVLFYLATGYAPPILEKKRKSNRELKKEITDLICKNNPSLYKSNLGVVDIILMCLCPNVDYRARHAGVMLETINAFDYTTPFDVSASEGSRHGITLIENALREVGKELKKLRTSPYSANELFQKIVFRRINSLKDDISPLHSRVFSISGDRDTHVNGLLDCLSVLRTGDEVLAVTSTRFWKKGNFGPYGRLSAMLVTLALRGVEIKWCLLVDDTLPSGEREVLRYQCNMIEDINECRDGYRNRAMESNLKIHYREIPLSELESIRQSKDFFILLRRGVDWTLVAPEYTDISGEISIIRLWADPRRKEEFKLIYADHLKHSKPISDFTH